MANILRLALDSLEPHEPSIIELANLLSESKGVSSANISIFELDRMLDMVKITNESDDIKP